MQPMPDLVEDTVVWPVLQRLQECLCAELAKANGPELCYCGMMVGDQMPLELAKCGAGGCGGVAWIRPMQAYASTEFPAPDEAPSCVAVLAMPVEIGVARCYPRGDIRVPVDPQEMFEAARLYMSDMRAMRRAVACCLNDDSFQGSYAMGTWEPIPALSGISGGTWTVVIRPEV